MLPITPERAAPEVPARLAKLAARTSYLVASTVREFLPGGDKVDHVPEAYAENLRDA
jgi:hypothetical protein